MKQTWSSKRFWITAVGLIVGMMLLQMWTEKRKLDKNLHSIAQKATEGMPRMIDSLMRVDSIFVVRPDALQYHYTFVSNDKSEIDTSVLTKEYRQAMIDWLKSEPKLAYLCENDISIELQYVDQHNQVICVTRILPAEYAVEK